MDDVGSKESIAEFMDKRTNIFPFYFFAPWQWGFSWIIKTSIFALHIEELTDNCSAFFPKYSIAP